MRAHFHASCQISVALNWFSLNINIEILTNTVHFGDHYESVCSSGARDQRSQTRPRTQRECKLWSRLETETDILNFRNKNNSIKFLTWNSCESFNIWGVWGDTVEDIDQDKEDCNQESHSARNNLRRNQEADLNISNVNLWIKLFSWTVYPRHNNKQTRRKVVIDQIFKRVPSQCHFKSCQRIISNGLPDEERVFWFEMIENYIVI